MTESWRSASPGLMLGWCLVAAAVTALAVAPYAARLDRDECALVHVQGECAQGGLVAAAGPAGALAMAGILVTVVRAWWRRDGWVPLCFGARVRRVAAVATGAALCVGALMLAMEGAQTRVAHCGLEGCASHVSPHAVVGALGGIVAAFAGALLAAQGVTGARSPDAPRSRPSQRPGPSPSPSLGPSP